ncbi:hypothetical protein GCM10008090_05460 [Arenicella chitinivorans]|uniref:Uncharacterized protein n=1 Tax=Arenicella chitinivorans TaxID=1329800 RepID=A0A918RK82_9GAMM|nr:hypothetical protein [Arenicella chitinivorans]GGZ99717.1 hypothetical protein GCM10008090_05460 [Arenicella chitinivorans]
MHIDRPMARLFFEIKRNSPFEKREDMKIAAPDVGERLVALYRESDNQALKKMIRTFMEHAGEDWVAQLSGTKKSKLLFYRVAQSR